MKIFDIFKKLMPKKESERMVERSRTPLPSDLERFRIRKGPMAEPERVSPSPYQTPEEEGSYFPPRPELPEVGPTSKPETRQILEKDDMILQKLETIDARLRLIEEKMR
ncbi:MAG: hypothetical protein KJ906_00420 [Nanoarchaeota archaeon]|nr:hypothetical protein [Nanoarchaeota archaeon]